MRYGLAIILVALILTPLASIGVGVSYPLFAMLQSAAIVVAAIAALLLMLQSRAVRSLPTAVLGAGFVFCAASMLPYALLFPGMFPGLAEAIGASAISYQYLWMQSQLGLVAAILAYQWLRLAERGDPAARARARLMIAALTLAYIVLTPVAIWFGGLPSTIEDGHWSGFFGAYMAPLIVVLAGVSIVETVRSRKRATVLDTWISLVALAMIVQTYIAVAGMSRFTIGWYASRAVVPFATSAVLAVLLVQASRVYSDLIQRAEVLLGEAHTDTLTGLPNRRRFDEEFARAFGSAIRRSSPIGVAIIDIDHFKDYNDRYGHQRGDECLRQVAGEINEAARRAGDFAARYGGEEFAIILANTSIEGAHAMAEAVRLSLRKRAIPFGDGVVTMSGGCATLVPADWQSAADLIAAADAALYIAKATGRDRVVTS